MGRKAKRAPYLSSILFLLVLVLAACGTNGNSTSNVTVASPDKQVLRDQVEGGDFDSLDPALTFGGLGDPYNILYSGLVALTDQGAVANQLATSYQISQDGLTYTFTIRSDAKFSDGTSIDANDVAYSLNRVLLPATKSAVTGYLSLLKDFDKITNGQIPTLIGDSIIVKSPTVISLIISKPAAYFLEALTYSTSDVVEKKLVDQYGAQWVDHMAQTGEGASGPFKVQSYGHTSALVLVPNPYYWAFKPKIQKIIYTIGSDRDTNYKTFQAGQSDYAPVPPALSAVASKKAGFQHVSALAVRFIEMNYLVKPLDNIHVRQALDLAINKDLIINHVININGPVVTPSNHIILDGIPSYNPKLTGPGGVTGTAGNQPLAKQLLQQGLQEEGLTQFPPLTITYNSSYQAGVETIISIVAEWKSVLGITIKTAGEQPSQLETDEVSTIGHTGPLQLWYGVWGADYPDAQDFLSNFFANGGQDNFENYGQNNSSDAAAQQAVQADLAKADGDPNATERQQIYDDAEQKIVNDVGWITTYQSSYSYSVNPKLQNWKLNSLGSIATSDWAKIYFSA